MDKNNNLKLKLQRPLKMRGIEASLVKEEIRRRLQEERVNLGMPQTVEIEVELAQGIPLETIFPPPPKFSSGNITTKASRILNQFASNPLAYEWEYGTYRTVRLAGEIIRVTRDNDAYYIQLDSTGLLGSHVHRIEKLLVRISEKKLLYSGIRASSEFKVGRIGTFKGFLRKVDNDIILDAQGNYIVLPKTFSARDAHRYMKRGHYARKLSTTFTIEIQPPSRVDVRIGDPIPVSD